MNAAAKLVSLLATASGMGWQAHKVTRRRVHLAHPLTGWRVSIPLHADLDGCALAEQVITTGARHRAPGTVGVFRVAPARGELARLMTQAPVSR